MIAVESSGNFQARGTSGENGTLQYMPKTWVIISKEIEGEVLPHTPANEKYVSVMKVQQLLNRGHNVQEIALIWNTSLGGVEKPLVKKSKAGAKIKYDSVAHAQKVLVAYNNN